MDYQNKRTKIGRHLYSSTLKVGEYLDKHIFLYWFLLLTWGIIESIAAFVLLIIFLVDGRELHKGHRGIYVYVGNNWGGFSLSFLSVIANGMGEDWTNRTIAHECGHSYQVCIWGPLWFFVVAIPSQIRWCVDRYKIKKKKPRIEYDLVWFEGSATDLGLEVTK